MIGLVGKTLKHSFSKRLHEMLGDAPYHLFETESLKTFIKQKHYQGLNITIPYKQEVIPFLDTLDDSVLVTNTCNTVVNKDGKLYGYNTDYLALVFLLKRHIKHENPTVAILGNGATMRSVKFALHALKITNIKIYARTPSKGELPISALKEDASVLINTTSVGMYPNNGQTLGLDLSKFKHLKLVFDVVYNPLKTDLILSAKQHNIKVIHGIDMLILQALFSRQYFFNEPFTLEAYRRTKIKLIKQLENIVLIGLPFSGKSYLGALLSQQMQKPYFDTDQIIEVATNMPVSEYFKQYGEKAFREVEEKHTINVAMKHGHIISTGGGTIMNPYVLTHLKQNSCLIFIDLSEALMDHIDYKKRPLVKNKQDLLALSKKRRTHYLNAADIIIKKDTLDENHLLQTIKEAYHAYFSNQWTES